MIITFSDIPSAFLLLFQYMVSFLGNMLPFFVIVWMSIFIGGLIFRTFIFFGRK